MSTAVAPPVAQVARRRQILPRSAMGVALWLSVAFLVLLVLVTVFAPLVAPHDPLDQDILDTYAPPSSEHLLGTDEVGRDVFSRLIYAGRTSLLAGLWATSIAGTVGVGLGLVAGYREGVVDQIFSRTNDTLLSVPGIVMAMAFIAVLGPGWKNAMTAVGIIFIPRFYRVARSASRSVSRAAYVEALVSVGCAHRRIVVRHVLPNIMSPIIVEATVVFSACILAEAALSFLGLGVQPPTPSWGGMLATAQNRPDATNLLYPAGIVLTLLILALSIVTDRLRDWVSGVRSRGVS